MLSLLLSSKMRVPLLTAIAVAGIVIYLISLHREIVTHNAKITELNESVQMLQHILHCCPSASTPILIPVGAPEPAPEPAPAPLARAKAEVDKNKDNNEDQYELTSVGSTELRNMLDIIGEYDEEGEGEGEANTKLEDQQLEDLGGKPNNDSGELDILTCADADLESIAYHRLKNLLKSNNINNKGTREVLLDRVREIRKTHTETC